MARRVFFHIGLPKTGTTYLQTTMWHNRPQLEACGFLYPGRLRMDHYWASRFVREGPKSRASGDAEVWARLVTALAGWDGDGLISHEFFCMASGRQARAAVQALAPAEVHVVVTARDYLRQFPAVWQEALKMNSELSFDAFMERALARELTGAWGWRSQDLPAVLATWSRTVPAEHVHVITVPPPAARRELLWQRWCDVLGLDDSGFDHDLTLANESLGVSQAALLYRVKPHLTDVLTEGTERHRWVRGYFGHQVLVPQGGPKIVPRPEHAAALRELSTQAVAEVAERGYDLAGDLADLVPPEEAPAGPHPDDVSESEMLEVAARAIDQMIHDVRKLTLEAEQRPSPGRRPADPSRGRSAGRSAGRSLRRSLGRLRRLGARWVAQAREGRVR